MSNNDTLYTDYTPDMSSFNDLPRTESEPDNDKKRPSAGRKVKNTRPKAKPQSKESAKPKPAETSVFTKVKDYFTSTTMKLIVGIFLACLGIYLLIAFLSYFVTCIQDQSIINSTAIGQAGKVANAGGEGGARMSEFLINECFGLGSLVIVVWLIAISLKLLVGRPRFKTVDFTIKCFIALITVSLIIGLITIGASTPVNWGGYHGRYVNEFIINFIGWTGAALLSMFMISLFVVICLRDMVKWIMRKVEKRRERRRKLAAERAEEEARQQEILRMQEQERIDDIKAGETTIIGNQTEDPVDDRHVDFGDSDGALYSLPADELDERISAADSAAESEPAESTASDIADESQHNSVADAVEEHTQQEAAGNSTSDKMVVNINTIGESDKVISKADSPVKGKRYEFPSVLLLREGKTQIITDPEEQKENKDKIESTLLDFRIPIVKIEATVGPTVTLYEIVPDKGVKIAQIRKLVDDIALSLSATGVRIIAPIPGKGTVGIEVANKRPQTVSMRTIIMSEKYQNSKFNLPVALGSTISNDVYIADLTKMPHLLVAGATGQGKSVGLNAIITSLLYKKTPDQLKFVMIDPKQVEFSLYNKIGRHYMAYLPGEEDMEPVITDTTRAENVLNSLCVEMENRYTLLKSAHVRNVEEYNSKYVHKELDEAEGHKFLPYIVVVVDEFGDLIMVSGKSVEMPIARLAQKARAVGIHVIIATQRPSVNVITGIIKANFPTRLSFKTTSATDSKTILDATGAQQLIGRGDMLIFNNSEMVRVQCAFVDTPEVEAICEDISGKPYPEKRYMLPEPPLGNGDGKGGEGDGSISDRDPKFDEVARAIVSGQTASTSSIQRHFQFGYTRAGRIMDQLERAGIVGPNMGGKPRSVLMTPMELEDFLATLN